MKVSWTQGLNAVDKDIISADFKASSALRKRLIFLLTEKGRSASNARLNPAEYEDPCWAYKQADNVGYQRALKEIIEFISD